MTSKFAAVLLGLGVGVLAFAPVDVSAKTACKTHHGRGWAPTMDMAKFQSWEITAQVTGNWPIKSDAFKNERYNCKPDGSGYTCISKIDVCKAS